MKYAIVLFLCLLGGGAAAQTEEVVANQVNEVVIAADNWCPINCGKDDPQQGYMIDVARLALKKSGYTLRYVEMPWARAVAMARIGEVHGIVGAYRGDAPDFIFPKYPLLVMTNNSLFTRIESDWTFTELKSLRGMRLGVVKGYDYGEELNSYIARYGDDSNRISLLAGNNPAERNIKQLLRGRIDVFVESAPVFWYTAKNLKVVQLVRDAGQVGSTENSYVAFSPQRKGIKAIVEALDRGVLELKRQGKLRTLARAYGLPESLVPKGY